MTKIVLHPQAERFVRALPPESRRALVKALKALPANAKPLEGKLAGYCQYRQGGFQIIFADSVRNGTRTFDCLFAERRSFVYELFEQILAEQALE